MVKHLSVDKPYIKHKPSIFTKKNIKCQGGRCLESLGLVRT